MKFALVAGARPQFIKAAALLPALREVGETLFVHTGQHYDSAMVEAHFDGLGLPQPDVRLHGIDDDIGPVLGDFGPDWVVVMGDTDSTLMGARGAAASGIPLAHVEAGARSGEPELPEEIVRIEVDRLSDLLCCSTEAHAQNLEGRNGVHVVGDLMADVLLAREDRLRPPREGNYAVLTLHRADAADDAETVGRVMGAAAAAGMPVVFPRHPRTKVSDAPEGIEVCDPMPYVEFLALVSGAQVVLTDSGGLQKEAYLLGVPCITLRDATEWGGTVDAGWNVLAGTDPQRIRAALASPPRADERPALYGDGDAAGRIATLLCAAGR